VDWNTVPTRDDLKPDQIFIHRISDPQALKTSHHRRGWDTEVVLQSPSHDGPTKEELMLPGQTLEVRAMPLIVLPVSALLLLWAWAGAYMLLNPSTVEPAARSVGLPMLLFFGGLFLASLVTLFNYRIRVNPDGITVLLPYGGSLVYSRDELNMSATRRILRLGPVGGAKLGWRRFFLPQSWINAYLVLERKETPAIA
jgi:hypothetical protein